MKQYPGVVVFIDIRVSVRISMCSFLQTNRTTVRTSAWLNEKIGLAEAFPDIKFLVPILNFLKDSFVISFVRVNTDIRGFSYQHAESVLVTPECGSSGFEEISTWCRLLTSAVRKK